MKSFPDPPPQQKNKNLMKEAKQIKRKTEVWVLIFFFTFYTKCSNTEMASEDASDIF